MCRSTAGRGRHCARRRGGSACRPPRRSALFPGGAADLVAGFSRWADRRMLDRLEAAAARTAARRRAHRAGDRHPRSTSWRRGARRCGARLTVLALPQNVPLGAAAALRDGRRHLVRRRRRTRPISAFTPSARAWRRSRPRRCSIGSKTARRRLCRHARLRRTPTRGRRPASAAPAASIAAAADHLPNPLRLLRPLR